jgi:hypothetical protein
MIWVTNGTMVISKIRYKQLTGTDCDTLPVIEAEFTGIQMTPVKLKKLREQYDRRIKYENIHNTNS